MKQAPRHRLFVNTMGQCMLNIHLDTFPGSLKGGSTQTFLEFHIKTFGSCGVKILIEGLETPDFGHFSAFILEINTRHSQLNLPWQENLHFLC